MDQLLPDGGNREQVSVVTNLPPVEGREQLSAVTSLVRMSGSQKDEAFVCLRKIVQISEEQEDTNYNLHEEYENCKWWSINGDRIFNNQHRRRAQALE